MYGFDSARGSPAGLCFPQRTSELMRIVGLREKTAASVFLSQYIACGHDDVRICLCADIICWCIALGSCGPRRSPYGQQEVGTLHYVKQICDRWRKNKCSRYQVLCPEKARVSNEPTPRGVRCLARLRHIHERTLPELLFPAVPAYWRPRSGRANHISAAANRMRRA